jgi:uncharacterized protein (DUF1697 family)
MSSHVALLRAVNLGPHNKVAMADLCRAFADAGMREARSLLQTGNVLFTSGVSSTAKLERSLETAALKDLGLKTDFFVRTVDEWKALIDANPFPDAAKNDPSHLVVMTLKDAPVAAAAAALQRAVKGRETTRVAGRHAFIVYPDGIGTSKLTTAVIERALGTRGTGRNWNTVLKIAAVLAGQPAARG